MKKYFVLIVLMYSISLQAQRFRGGLLFGLNASQVDGDTYAGYNKFGVALGSYVFTPLSKTVDIQLEIKYMGKGAHNSPSNNYPVNYTNQLNYIEIPVIFRIKTGTIIDLEGGLAYGYLFSNSMKDDYGSYDIQGLFNKSDYSGIIGLLYKANPRLSVSMRISYSLVTIRDDISSISYLKSRGVFNNVLSIALFYELQSKKEE